jgi:hypothetical protein
MVASGDAAHPQLLLTGGWGGGHDFRSERLPKLHVVLYSRCHLVHLPVPITTGQRCCMRSWKLLLPRERPRSRCEGRQQPGWPMSLPADMSLEHLRSTCADRPHYSTTDTHTFYNVEGLFEQSLSLHAGSRSYTPRIPCLLCLPNVRHSS